MANFPKASRAMSVLGMAPRHGMWLTTFGEATSLSLQRRADLAKSVKLVLTNNGYTELVSFEITDHGAMRTTFYVDAAKDLSKAVEMVEHADHGIVTLEVNERGVTQAEIDSLLAAKADAAAPVTANLQPVMYLENGVFTPSIEALATVIEALKWYAHTGGGDQEEMLRAQDLVTTFEHVDTYGL